MVYVVLENGSILVIIVSFVFEEFKVEVVFEEEAVVLVVMLERGVDNGWVLDMVFEEVDEFKKEDFLEVDLVDVSVYSGFGEDFGGSVLEEDDEEDEEDGEFFYELELGCVEIFGFLEEEDLVLSWKIYFSIVLI